MRICREFATTAGNSSCCWCFIFICFLFGYQESIGKKLGTVCFIMNLWFVLVPWIITSILSSISHLQLENQLNSLPIKDGRMWKEKGGLMVMVMLIYSGIYCWCSGEWAIQRQGNGGWVFIVFLVYHMCGRVLRQRTKFWDAIRWVSFYVTYCNYITLVSFNC